MVHGFRELHLRSLGSIAYEPAHVREKRILEVWEQSGGEEAQPQGLTQWRTSSSETIGVAVIFQVPTAFFFRPTLWRYTHQTARPGDC